MEIGSAVSDASAAAASQAPAKFGFRLKDNAVTAAVSATQKPKFGFRQKVVNPQQAAIEQQAELAARQQQALASKVAGRINSQPGALASARAQRSVNEAQQAIKQLSDTQTKAALEQAYRDAAKQANQLLASGSLQEKMDVVIGAAIEAVDRAGDDINQAIAAWDSMSDAQKQALVEKVNREGLLGCTSCTVADAEAYANSKR